MIAFLTSPLGRAGMIGLLFMALLASCGVQTSRLHHAKGDLVTARAALVDPLTKLSWESEYGLASTNLRTCKSDRDAFKADFDLQTQATEAAKQDTARRDAAVASARQAAQKSAAAAQAAGDQLSAYRATGADACARMLDADRKVKELTR